MKWLKNKSCCYAVAYEIPNRCKRTAQADWISAMDIDFLRNVSLFKGLNEED